MATLAGQKIKDKYGNLLHVEGGANATVKAVEDGGGTATALSVSTDKVQVDALKFTTAPASGSSATALALDGNNDVVLVPVGSGGGAVALDDLTDVALVNASNGDMLYFDGTNWVNYTFGEIGLIGGIVDANNVLNFIGANTSGNVLFDAGSGMSISYNNSTSTLTFESTSSGFEEMLIGAVPSDITLSTSGSSSIVPYTTVSNTTDSTSFHFKIGTAQLLLDASNGTVENQSSAAIPVHIDITAFTEATSNNSAITYALQKYNGTAWNNIKSVTRSKSTVGSHADSFWSIFMLGVNEKFRIEISTTTGSITLSQDTRVSFTVKEVGN